MTTTPPPLSIHGHTLSFATPVLMGIINTTPDSFYDGGKHQDPFVAVEAGRRLAAQGAQILDVGGESTRPGSQSLPWEEEVRRVVPVVHMLADEGYLVSVDTMKAQVAQATLEAGAAIINDVSGGRDPELLSIVEGFGAAIVLGHMRGVPESMQNSIAFSNVMEEVEKELLDAAERALRYNIPPSHVILDPGIGFGKTAAQCAELMARSGQLSRRTGYPVLVGPSNKSFIGALSGAPVENRLPGTVASSVLSLLGGAQLFRIHNVQALAQAFAVAEAMLPYITLCSD